MSASPNLINVDGEIVVARPYEMLTEIQRAYIDYKAISGIFTNDDEVKKVSVTELAQMLGCSKQAIYDGKKYVPNFWDLVAQRRKELGRESRLSRIHETFYLKALKMDNWQISEAWLRNFDPDYKESKQKVEVDMTDNFAEAIRAAKTRREVIEGEIVDGKDNA